MQFQVTVRRPVLGGLGLLSFFASPFWRFVGDVSSVDFLYGLGSAIGQKHMQAVAAWGPFIGLVVGAAMIVSALRRQALQTGEQPPAPQSTPATGLMNDPVYQRGKKIAINTELQTVRADLEKKKRELEASETDKAKLWSELQAIRGISETVERERYEWRAKVAELEQEKDSLIRELSATQADFRQFEQLSKDAYHDLWCKAEYGPEVPILSPLGNTGLIRHEVEKLMPSLTRAAEALRQLVGELLGHLTVTGGDDTPVHELAKILRKDVVERETHVHAHLVTEIQIPDRDPRQSLAGFYVAYHHERRWALRLSEIQRQGIETAPSYATWYAADVRLAEKLEEILKTTLFADLRGVIATVNPRLRIPVDMPTPLFQPSSLDPAARRPSESVS